MILPTHQTNPPSSLFTLELIQNQIEMRGRSSINQETIEGMEFDDLIQLKEEPHLSGAYICSLVEQLSTSRAKDSMNSKEQDCIVDADVSRRQYSTKHGKVLDAQQAQQPTQPKQRKKKVRRRLNTSKPYQERLLNMAEARREIANALKHHRAAMKQASEKQQQQQQQPQEQQQQPSLSLQPPQQPNFEQEGRMKSRRNPRIYPSRTPDFSTYMDNFYYSSFSQPPSTAPNPFSWPSASPVAQPLLAENPNFILPSQALGLNFNLHDFNNLNFHDFNYLDASLCCNSNNTSLYPYSFPSSSSHPVPVITDQELPSAAISQGEGSSQLVDIIDSSAATLVTGGFHTAMDDEGMAEIRSLGEQYQMEWNDKMNSITSAWWFKFSQNMELGATEAEIEEGTYPNFEELVEFPASLNANESCLEQSSEEYFQDPCLPW